MWFLCWLLACVPLDVVEPESEPIPGTDPPSTSTTPDDSTPPHLCLGAMLRASWDGALDGDALIDAIETELPEVSCWANEAAGFVECTPVEDECAWTVEEASAAADTFLEVLEAFDPVFADYPHGVVDECACRAFR